MKGSTQKKLDAIFSKYIRLRDANAYGMCSCISCGKMHHWKNMDCGHFVPRIHNATRYSEKNCNAQCKECNRSKSGNLKSYVRGLQQKYKGNVVEELHFFGRQEMKITECEAREMIEEYKAIVTVMQKEK